MSRCCHSNRHSCAPPGLAATSRQGSHVPKPRRLQAYGGAATTPEYRDSWGDVMPATHATCNSCVETVPSLTFVSPSNRLCHKIRHKWSYCTCTCLRNRYRGAVPRHPEVALAMGRPRKVHTREEEAAYREAQCAADRECRRPQRTDPVFVANEAAVKRRRRADLDYAWREIERETSHAQ